MSAEEQIVAQNPWWTDPAAIQRDRHLRAYRDGGLEWTPPALDSIALRPGDADTLRGPRQVGKTTTVKRMIGDLLRRGETRVLYFSLDLVRDFREIPEVLSVAKRLHPDPEGAWHIFLDEVTSVPEWQVGIKYAWDQGLTRDDYLLLTGSSAHDIRRGAEQLPGRRGSGTDYLQLPMSFRDFARTAFRFDLPPRALSVEECLTTDGRRVLTTLNLRFRELESAWNAYRITGGYPAAVRDLRAGRRPEVSPSTVRTLWNTITGDIVRTGRDAICALKLLEEVAISLGNPLKWTSAGNAMGVSDVTARQYVEHLAESFALLTVYFWDLGGRTLSPGKQRKIYFIDPLIGSIPSCVVPGARIPPADGVVENLVAIGLFRSSSQTLVQAGAAPGSVAYWRSANQREIDFVVPTASGGLRFPVEVKGDSDGGIGHARLAIRRAFGRGLVVSRSVFEWADDVTVVPASVLLAALREQPRRELFAA